MSFRLLRGPNDSRHRNPGKARYAIFIHHLISASFVLAVAAAPLLVPKEAAAADYAAGGGINNAPSGSATAVGSQANTTGAIKLIAGFERPANG
jgi:hypothetical protein